MKDIVDTDEPDESSMVESEKLSPENSSELLLGGFDSSSTSVHDLQPDPVHAFRLWQIFLDRVNPLLKVVHIPTLQPYVMDGAISIGNVPLNYQALLFAVYTISAVSMSVAEAPEMLGMSREDAIQRYTKGMKTALVTFDFMKNYDMAALQALLLYIVSSHLTLFIWYGYTHQDPVHTTRPIRQTRHLDPQRYYAPDGTENGLSP